MTGYEFERHCKAYGKAAGFGKKDYPVLTRRVHTGEWRAWMAWFEREGMRESVKVMRDPNRTSWTVPTMMPSAFDAFIQTGTV